MVFKVSVTFSHRKEGEDTRYCTRRCHHQTGKSSWASSRSLRQHSRSLLHVTYDRRRCAMVGPQHSALGTLHHATSCVRAPVRGRRSPFQQYDIPHRVGVDRRRRLWLFSLSINGIVDFCSEAPGPCIVFGVRLGRFRWSASGGACFGWCVLGVVLLASTRGSDRLVVQIFPSRSGRFS